MISAPITSPAAARRRGCGSLSAEQIATYHGEGYLVLEQLLDFEDMLPFRESVNLRVDEIAADLFQLGLIPHQFEDRPFETRLADLFANLTDQAGGIVCRVTITSCPLQK